MPSLESQIRRSKSDAAITFVESTTNPMTHGAANLCAGIRPRRRGRSFACVMRKAAVIVDAKLEA